MRLFTGRIQFFDSGYLCNFPVRIEAWTFTQALEELKEEYRIHESQIVKLSIQDAPMIKKHEEQARAAFDERIARKRSSNPKG